MRLFGWRTALLATSLFGAAATPALAQAPTDPAATSDEVLVTATRRAERLQDVPVAVTALSADALEQAQVTSIEDIGSLTPNLISTPGTAGGARSSPLFAIRGQSQQERGGMADSSVAVYFNDVVMARTQGLNQNMYDLQAIEVIRGPVGTLFGRNATGGAVLIRPNAPELGSFEYGVGGTIAEFGRQEFDAFANLPIGDTMALRIAAGSTQSDGYIYDTTLQRNINNEDSWSARASLLFERDNFRNVLLWGHFDEDDGGSGGQAVAFNHAASATINTPATAGPRNYPANATTVLANEQAALGHYRINNGVPEYNVVTTTDVQNTTTLDLNENITLKNIMGYRVMDSHILIDLDGTRLPILHSEIIDDAEQWTEEFQILGNTGIFNWIAGAYYFIENGANNAASLSLGVDTPGAIEPSTHFNITGAINNHQQYENTSTAVFAEATADLSSWLPGLSLTAGVRQTWDEKTATILNRNVNTTCRFTIDHDDNPGTPNINPGAGPNCRVDAAAEFDAFTYNLGANYKLDDDTLIYASLRKGFRAGGFQARATTEQGLLRPNDPEIVITREIGLKRDWHFGDAFLRTNVAVFSSDYSDIQRQINDTTQTPAFSVTVNAAEATVNGVEAEIVFRPFDRLELSGFWGYTDATFDSFINPFTLADLSGTKFSRTPENTWRVSGAYDLVRGASFGDLTLAAAFYGRDEYLTIDNTVNAAADTIAAYDQIDLFLQWRSVYQSNVDVTFFVRNVEDNTEFSASSSLFSQYGVSNNVSEPRVAGIQFRARFQPD